MSQYKTIKYIPLLLLSPKKGVVELSKEDNILTAILSFVIIATAWGFTAKAIFNESILQTIALGIFQLLTVTSIFYGITLLLRGRTSFKNSLQVMAYIGIIYYIFFQPLHILALLLKFNASTRYVELRVIGVVEIIWAIFVLTYYGKEICTLKRFKPFLVSMATLIIFLLINFTVLWRTI